MPDSGSGKRNGFLQLDNELLEALALEPLTGGQFRVVHLILRNSAGYRRKDTDYSGSLQAIERGTGLHMTHVCKALAALREKGIVARVAKPSKSGPVWAYRVRQPSEWGVPEEDEQEPLFDHEGTSTGASRVLARKLVGGTSTEAKQGTSTEARQEIQHRNTELPSPSFPHFWGEYPRKVGKKDAEKVFRKLAPSEELLETILADIRRRLSSGEWKLEERGFIPYPATYLNGERWEDEVEAEEERVPPEPIPFSEEEYRRREGIE